MAALSGSLGPRKRRGRRPVLMSDNVKLSDIISLARFSCAVAGVFPLKL